ncbi:MAG: amino acid adenylation domain-containing protein [Firmicutes bacterium]|nr:amino acid adenylation domain-containing protein [Bacillota bacterium]
MSGKKHFLGPVPVSQEYPAPEYPASSAQQRMYVLQQLSPGSTAYNMGVIIRITREIDPWRLEDAFQRLIERQEALRTFFAFKDGSLVYKITPRAQFTLEVEAALKTAPEEIQTVFQSFIRPFDLSQAPLFRARLVKIGAGESYLLLDLHHIISDGASVAILTRELAALYEGESLPELRIQYKDYCAWMNKWSETEDFMRQKRYWLETFAGEIPLLNLPLDRPRGVRSPETAASNPAAGRWLFTVAGKETTRRLENLAFKRRTTLNGLMIAIYALMLSKYSGQDELIVGSVVSGRNHPDLKHLIGIFINTLPLKLRVSREGPFLEYLAGVSEVARKAYENQDYPFEKLVQLLPLEPDRTRNPLVDTLLVFHSELGFGNSQSVTPEAPFFECRRMAPGAAMMDLVLEIFPVAGALEGSLEYDGSLFNPETIRRMAVHLRNLAERVAAKPDLSMADMEMLSPAEKQRILEVFNHPAPEARPLKAVASQFEAQAALTPDRIAVQDGASKMTYRELNRRVNGLAKLLRQKGVRAGSIVAVRIRRSMELIAVFLAVWKAGGCYLPLDVKLPGDRMRYMLEDSGADILIARRYDSLDTGNSGAHARKWRALALDLDMMPVEYGTDENPPPQNTLQDPAYVIYTSGSTGRPKGMIIEHRNLSAYLEAFQKEFQISGADVVLQQASASFDAFVEEVYPALTRGGRVAIAPDETVIDPKNLWEFIRQNQVTVISVSPLLLNELNRSYPGPGPAVETVLKPVSNLQPVLRLVISGGDCLKPEYISNLAGRVPVYNTYGPTETTVCATYYPTGVILENKPVPIGAPVSGYQVYVLDQHQSLAPVGVWGEIWIGGAGVGRGYLNQPELTAGKFLTNPFYAGAFHEIPLHGTPQPQIYRTGDLARWTSDGNLEFGGRKDYQVKIRGYRIELSEVEREIFNSGLVRETVVISRQDRFGNLYLAAYFTADTETASGLREYLERKLPAYMVPAYLIKLPRLPRTPGGKYDRRALPAPEEWINSVGEYRPPQNEIERFLANIWQEVLGLSRIGMGDRFFDLGGDSLRLIQVQARIEEHFPGRLTVADLFSLPTIPQIAAFLTGGPQSPAHHQGRGGISRPGLTDADSGHTTDSFRDMDEDARIRAIFTGFTTGRLGLAEAVRRLRRVE